MKKIIICLMLSLFYCTSYAQFNNDDLDCSAKYRIVGKGSSGQTACSGYIYIVPSASSCSVKLKITNKFTQTYCVQGCETVDGMNRIYRSYGSLFGLNDDGTNVLVQICSHNPNVRFVVFQHFNENGVYAQDIYKTVKEIERD